MVLLHRGIVRALLVVSLLMIALVGAGLAEELPSNAMMTEGELAATLVRALGLESGLPAEPKPADYQAILSGSRAYRFEAEDVYDAKRDNTSIRSYPLYGPFTGSGWLSGLATPTKIRFTVFLPRAGEYLLTVVAKGNGQQWQVGDRTYRVDTGDSLREAVVGKVALAAGTQMIDLTLPPEGGVDSFSLTAASLAPIEPLGGWNFPATLTWDRLAEILASLQGLENRLPVDEPGGVRVINVADSAVLPATATKTAIDYLGAHTAPRWVRAGIRGARLEMPLDFPAPGVYAIRLRLLGEHLTVDFDGTKTELPGKPYFNWFDLGLKRVVRGRRLLIVNLPPLGGADIVQLTRYNASPREYLLLTGLPGTAGKPVPRAECEKYLKLALDRMRGQK